MRPGEIAFLQSIHQEPDDDSVRMIYADWLEEQGEVNRAELIRAQCELHTLAPESPKYSYWLDQAEKQLSLNGRKMLQQDVGSSASCIGQFHYDRGFLSYVQSSIADFLRHGRTWLEAAPSLALEISYRQDNSFESLSEHQEAFMLKELRIPQHDLFDTDLAPLLNIPFQDLRSLNLDRNHLGADGAQLIASCPSFQNLRTLSLRSNVFNTDGAIYLADSTILNNLTALDLSHNHVQDEGLIAILESLPHTLRSLNISRCDISDSTVEELCQSSLKQMKTLSLGELGELITLEGIQALVSSDLFQNLTSLSIERTSIPSDVLTCFAQRQEIFHELALSRCGIGQEHLAPLQNLPPLTGRKRLDLSNNELDEGMLEVIARSPLLLSAREIVLDGNPIQDNGLSALLRESSGNLRHLSLRGCGLSDESARRLAEWSQLRNLVTLDLENNPVTEHGRRALERSAYTSGQLKNQILARSSSRTSQEF